MKPQTHNSVESVTPEIAAALRPLISKKTFKPKEAAQYCGFGITSTYRLLAAGTMPSIRVGSRYYIPHVALDKWLESEPFVNVKKQLDLLNGK